MKLEKHHLALIVLIFLCIIVNYIVFFGIPKKNTSVEEDIVYVNSIYKNSSSTIQSDEEQDVINDIEIIKRPDWEPVSILSFGDTMFDRGVRRKIEQGVDLFSSFRELNITKEYDIRLLNLEGPIIEIERSKCQQKAYNFQFNTNTAKLLKKEGITSVSLANNHIYDCYTEGVNSTINFLKESNIGIIGSPLKNENYQKITTKDGTRVALIGIDTTITTLNKINLVNEIKLLSSENDVVIAIVHWGEEYLEKANQSQVELAKMIIDSGADAIIGNHPHVIENMEVYKNKPIFYSLGNFIFDQIGEKENEGFGVGLQISQDETNIMLFPYKIISSVPTFINMRDSNEWCSNYYSNNSIINHEGCSAKITNK